MAEQKPYWEKAAEAATLARRKDDEEKFEEAMKGYICAVDYLKLAVKYQAHNQSMVDSFNASMLEYLNRAEKLKEFISSGAPPPSKRSSSGGGTKAKKKGEDDDDEEKAKMQNALAGAIVKESPGIHWDDVAGLVQAKEALQEAVILPITYPQLFVGKRKPWRGILLYGPPGTGKSFLAKAVATEASSTFLSVSSADLVSKWLGDSEKLIRTLFETARQEKPAIIFIDEIDSLATTRSESESESSRRIKTEFLVQMQGLNEGMDGVLVLAATNLPWNIDSAVRRRFEKRIYIPLPDAPARARMFELNLGNTPATVTKDDKKRLAEMTDGYSGSDISVLVRDAIMEPVRKCQDAVRFKTVKGPDPNNPTVIRSDLLMPCSPSEPGADMTLKQVPPDRLCPPPVVYKDFEKALKKVKPSVGHGDLEQYRQWTEEFGQEG